MISGHQLAVGRGTLPLFTDASFSLPAGECWAVVGRNGSGKTTLLATLAGLIPSLGGEVRIMGKRLRVWRRSELARHLAFLPQYQAAVFPYTVEEFVRFGRVPWRPDHNGHEAVDAAIAAMELFPIRARPLTALSGGEVQRVCIAQLLAQTTEILLLDEPMAHLDLLHQVVVMRLLRRRADDGHAVTVVTHDLNLAWRYCDRLLVLRTGGVRLVARDDLGSVADALRWAYDVEFEVSATDGPRPLIPGF